MENIHINNNVNAQKALDTAMSKTLREFKFNETDHQLVNFKASLHGEFYSDSCKQVAEHYGLKESMLDQK